MTGLLNLFHFLVYNFPPSVLKRQRGNFEPEECI